MPRLFVITGGPCAGKTTLVNELERRGYKVLHETAATIVIPQLLAEGKNPDKNFEEMEDRIFTEQLLREESLKELPDDEIVFLDRCLVGSPTAYYALRGLPIPKSLTEALRGRRYEKVFFLELLPFEGTDIRYEKSTDEVLRVHALIRQAHEEHGSAIVDVPAGSVEERLAMILQHIAATG